MYIPLNLQACHWKRPDQVQEGYSADSVYGKRHIHLHEKEEQDSRYRCSKDVYEIPSRDQQNETAYLFSFLAAFASPLPSQARFLSLILDCCGRRSATSRTVGEGRQGALARVDVAAK